MTTPRFELLKLAEQVRSTIVEVVKHSPEPMTVRELCEEAHVRAHFSNTTPELAYIDRIVRDLHKVGVLRKIHISRPKQNSRYAYEYTGKEFSPAERKITQVIRAAASSVPPDVKLTVTKSGALRVSFKGLSIEIGVEQ